MSKTERNMVKVDGVWVTEGTKSVGQVNAEKQDKADRLLLVIMCILFVALPVICVALAIYS